MGRDDWHRAETWTREAEAHFEKKLARARRKASALRVQGATLGGSDKARDRAVAKMLLRRAIDRGEQSPDDAFEAFWALYELGRVEERDGEDDAAAAVYRESHCRRDEQPNVHMPAALDLACLIARTRRRDEYSEAIDLLNWTWEHRPPTFYADGFRSHLARARIAADTGNRATAREFATEALLLAAIDEPQLSRHPDVGLVKSDRKTLRELKRLAR